MTLDYLPYVIVEVYCFLLALVVLSQLNSSIGSEHQVKQLKCMIYSYMIMLVSDIVFGLVEGGYLALNSTLYAASNAITIFSISIGCYFWYRFVVDRLHPTYTFSRAYRYLISIPIAVIFVLNAASIFTGTMFYIDAGGQYHAADWFVIQSIVNFAYAIIPTINSLFRAIRTHSKLKQSEYATYGVYILAPVTASILEDVIPTVPILALNIFVVILLLFLTLQNMQVYNDALTSLNNRRRLDQYLDERLETASEQNPVVLYMLDINRFKSINDKYGHIEGDNALRTFANALKVAANKHGAFIARYGGDEFCMVTSTLPDSIESLESEINAALGELATSPNKNLPYSISTSIGYAMRTQPGFDVSTFMAEADAMLYANKQRWHREND